MDQTVTIGGRIAYLLEKENMTQRELANKINVYRECDNALIAIHTLYFDVEL